MLSFQGCRVLRASSISVPVRCDNVSVFATSLSLIHVILGAYLHNQRPKVS